MGGMISARIYPPSSLRKVRVHADISATGPKELNIMVLLLRRNAKDKEKEERATKD